MNRQIFTVLCLAVFSLIGCNTATPELNANQMNETAQIIAKLSDSIQRSSAF